jgi:hypothetical protein
LAAWICPSIAFRFPVVFCFITSQIFVPLFIRLPIIQPATMAV